MTATNPHPLANPYNTRRFGNFNIDRAVQKSYINTSRNPKTLGVPQSTMSYDEIIERQRSLTVPYQDDLPDGDTTGGMGFIGNTSLFRLGDSSIIDLKTCKIVYDPNEKFKKQGYWRDPNEQSKQNTKNNNDWEMTPSIEQLIQTIDKSDQQICDPNLSEYDIKYWQKVKEESKKLEQSLTDEQKQLLTKLNNGEIFPLSRLTDDI